MAVNGSLFDLSGRVAASSQRHRTGLDRDGHDSRDERFDP
jgi:hypothetical protein